MSKSVNSNQPVNSGQSVDVVTPVDQTPDPIVAAMTSVLPDYISWADWQKLDIRVGTIVAAHNPEWSEKLIELRVHFGSEVGERTIFTGLRAWYSPEHFINKQGLFIINIAPRKMGPAVSEGMFVSLDSTDAAGKPHLMLFAHLAPDGSALC